MWSTLGQSGIRGSILSLLGKIPPDEWQEVLCSLLSALRAIAEEVALGAVAAMLGPGEERVLIYWGMSSGKRGRPDSLMSSSGLGRIWRENSCVLSHFGCVQLFVTLWTVASQAPLSIGFFRQEYWSRLLLPSPGDLPDSGIEPGSPVWQADFFTIWAMESSNLLARTPQLAPPVLISRVSM